MNDQVSKPFQAALFVLFLSLYVLTMKGICTGDNILHYDRTQTIIREGDLSMPEERYARQPFLSLWMAKGKDGKVYLTLGDGLSIAAVPLALVGNLVDALVGGPGYEQRLQHIYAARETGDDGASAESFARLRAIPSAFFAVLINPIVMALTALFFFKFCHALTNSRSQAFLGSLLLGVGTILWAYSSTFWTQPIVTFCLFTAFYCVFASVRDGRSGPAVLAGVLVGYAFITRYFSVVALPWLATYLVLGCRRQKRSSVRPLVLMLLPVAGFVILQMGWNHYRFGSLLNTGGWHQARLKGLFRAKVHVSIPALLVGLDRSLFVFSPPLVLGLFGIKSFARRHKVEAALLLGVVTTYLVVYGRLTMWMALGSWGPRFLVPVTPFLLLPACFFTARPLWRKLLLHGLLAVGIAVQLVAVLLPLQHEAIGEYLGGMPRGADYFLKSEILPQAKVLLSGKIELWPFDGPVKAAFGVVLFVAMLASLGYCIRNIRSVARPPAGSTA